MKNTHYEGPTMSISNEIDSMKYRQEGETFNCKVIRLAGALMDSEEHRMYLEDILGNMRFLAAGRVQSSMGASKITTAYNCFVIGDIEDSMDSIMEKAHEAAETMRRGGGCGYDFSRIRPRGDIIHSLNSQASGPVSYMGIYDAVCQTISSSGHRRGAQMAVLRVDHPDVGEFVRAKRNSDKLTGFNISVGVTDKFMEALEAEDDSFDLIFNGKVYETISARALWNDIMESNYDWAEPGVLFLDRMNEMNNLWYCETLAATNPCAEQPLPSNGACLLGSFNLTKYLECTKVHDKYDHYSFDYALFKRDIPHVVRAMDNVIDRTVYPLKAQEDEARNKRRMGLGLTGLANTGELLGYPYGSPEFLEWSEGIFKLLRNGTYRASADLAQEKGPFPMYSEKLLKSGFAKTLPYKLRKRIKEYGLRNSHLTSIAPTGTISLVADNISGGIEPTFSRSYDRIIQTFDGPRTDRVQDYAVSKGATVRTADELTVKDHLAVLSLAQYYVDSACSKTINVGDDIDYKSFKDIYAQAWKEGCKGTTTFRLSGKRFGILKAVETEEETEIEAESTAEESTTQAEACYFDVNTGQRECS